MLYREIIAVCSEIHTKHTNTLCGQNVKLLNIEPRGPKKEIRAFLPNNPQFSKDYYFFESYCSSPVCSPDNSNM